ncbi:hypothetical protein CLF_100301 [Clonorchis sinensis]|uniref:Uncharacterized protein n=1 Tax=Clonorchis sinensis TaxID=79923 RepID=G7Y353_CLOSI|nr:hypothetical protein CLF_100301 [Clonorchis sinensis]
MEVYLEIWYHKYNSKMMKYSKNLKAWDYAGFFTAVEELLIPNPIPKSSPTRCPPEKSVLPATTQFSNQLEGVYIDRAPARIGTCLWSPGYSRSFARCVSNTIGRLHTKVRDDHGQFVQKQLRLLFLFEDENNVRIFRIDKGFVTGYFDAGAPDTFKRRYREFSDQDMKHERRVHLVFPYHTLHELYRENRLRTAVSRYPVRTVTISKGAYLAAEASGSPEVAGVEWTMHSALENTFHMADKVDMSHGGKPFTVSGRNIDDYTATHSSTSKDSDALEETSLTWTERPKYVELSALLSVKDDKGEAVNFTPKLQLVSWTGSDLRRQAAKPTDKSTTCIDLDIRACRENRTTNENVKLPISSSTSSKGPNSQCHELDHSKQVNPSYTQLVMLIVGDSGVYKTRKKCDCSQTGRIRIAKSGNCWLASRNPEPQTWIRNFCHAGFSGVRIFLEQAKRTPVSVEDSYRTIVQKVHEADEVFVPKRPARSQMNRKLPKRVRRLLEKSGQEEYGTGAWHEVDDSLCRGTLTKTGLKNNRKSPDKVGCMIWMRGTRSSSSRLSDRTFPERVPKLIRNDDNVGHNF